MATVWRSLASGLPGSIKIRQPRPAAAQYAAIAELALPDDAVRIRSAPESKASAAANAPARSLKAPLGFNPSCLKYKFAKPRLPPSRLERISGV